MVKRKNKKMAGKFKKPAGREKAKTARRQKAAARAAEAAEKLRALQLELRRLRSLVKEIAGRYLQKQEARLARLAELLAELKDADTLYKKIAALDIPRLREQHIHKIVELLPATVQDMKVVLQGYTLNISQENMKKIAALVAEFASK